MRCLETRSKSPIVASPSLQWAPNNSFKPNLLRYTKHMAEKACHVFGSTAQVGLTQALDAAHTFRGRDEDHSRSEATTSVLQSLMPHSYSVLLLKYKKV